MEKLLSEVLIDDLFSTKLKNTLRKAGIENLGDIASKDSSELRRTRGIGERNLAKIYKVLTHFRPERRQRAVSGVVAGFGIVVHWVGENKVFQTDTREEMWQIDSEWTRRSRDEKWIYPLMTDHFIRFIAKSATEEDWRSTAIYYSNIANLTKGIPAHKAFCVCGKHIWRIGRIKNSDDKGKYVCYECKERNKIIAREQKKG